MKLTRSFTLSELTATNHRELADRNHQVAANSPDLLANLISVASLLLQPIRDHYDSPLVVNSGFRGPELNAAIGGSKSSQHMKAEAADFWVPGQDLTEIFDWIRLESGIPYGQLICEGVKADKPTWIHISLGYPWRPKTKSGVAMTWSKAGGYTVVT
jgi:zinc D-Ala-D-Ala carboxypeptidase